MSGDFEQALRSVGVWCDQHGIRATSHTMKAGKAGEFDGVSITMNREYSPEERLYYMTHALGSIARWSVSRKAVQAMFDELRDSKEDKENARDRFEKAISDYRAFETESSEFAVWLLAELGYEGLVDPYSNFMRADLESMTQFHRTGEAPVWRRFFGEWNREVAEGRRRVERFPAKPMPSFTPVKIEHQEILQRQEDDS